MANLCKCDSNDSFNKNTGRQAQFLGKHPATFWFMQKYNSDGEENVLFDNVYFIVDSTEAELKTYFESLINHADPTKRLYPFPPAFTIEETYENHRFEELGINKKISLGDGQASVTAVLPDTAMNFKKTIDSLDCQELIVYIPDVCGNIRGLYVQQASGEYAVSPFKGFTIQKSTLTAKPVPATETTSEKVAISFMFDLYTNFGDVHHFEAGKWVLKLKGLINVYSLIFEVQTTYIPFAAQFISGFVTASNFITTFLAADFQLKNITTNTVLSPVLTKDANGVYYLNFPAQTVGDELELTMLPTVRTKGFDLASFKATFEIPSGS